MSLEALRERMKEPATKTDVIIAFSVLCFAGAIFIVVTS